MRRAVVIAFLLALVTLTAKGQKPQGQMKSEKVGPVVIDVWHASSGKNGELLQQISDDFNNSQTDYQVKLTYRGSYVETMNSGIAAYRAGEAPHLLQVFEVGTQTMIASGVTEKVSDLFTSAGLKLSDLNLIPTVSGYYGGDGGVLYSVPFNSSTPVLYYNKEAFRQAGLDPERPPKTWEEMGEYGQKLVASGFPGGFTTSWPSWVLLENLAAWHGVPLASNNNGFDGNNAELKLLVTQDPFLHTLDRLAAWHQQDIFIYGGRTNKAEPLFLSKKVAMITSSSATYNSYRSADFDFGMAQLPYWADQPGAPQNTIIGGASFWAFKGASEAEKKAMVSFFRFILSDDVQMNWHKETGYVPVTSSAYRKLKEQGFYQQRPEMEIALLQLTDRQPRPFTRGVRIGNLPQIRELFYGELEALLAGKKDGKQALADYAAAAQKVIDQYVADLG